MALSSFLNGLFNNDDNANPEKESQSDNINDEQREIKYHTQMKQEIDKILKQEIQYRIMHNPYVIIIGITKYDLPWNSLKGITDDINKMKDLWINKFKYQNVTVVTEEIESDYISAEKLNSNLNDISARIQLNKSVDGLILIYTGHGAIRGHDTFIICSDGEALSLTSIENKFNSDKLDYLCNAPKLIYLDCCRGNNEIKENQIKFQSQSKGNKVAFTNKYSDFIIHFATCYDNVA